MKKTILILLLIVIVFTLLLPSVSAWPCVQTTCSPNKCTLGWLGMDFCPSSCTSDSQCINGYLCQAGKCIMKPSGGTKEVGETCDNNDECVTNYCDLTSQYTTDPNQADSEPQCVECGTKVPQTFMDPVNGKPMMMLTPVSCKTGFYCDETKSPNLCVECLKNSDCSSGKICQNNKCEIVGEETTPACTTDNDCPTKQKCETNKCIPVQCKIKNDCSPNSDCVNYQCTAKENQCPTASISINPNQPDKNQLTQLKAITSDYDGDPVTCSWKIDGKTVAGCTTNQKFTTNGQHTVILTVNDYACIVPPIEKTITVGKCLSDDHVIYTVSAYSSANVGDNKLYTREVCHPGPTALSRTCTGANEVIKSTEDKKALKPYSIYQPKQIPLTTAEKQKYTQRGETPPLYRTQKIDTICYGDYSCYVEENEWSMGCSKEGFACFGSVASLDDTQPTLGGECLGNKYNLCCKQNCQLVDMKCGQYILNQDGQDYTEYHACGDKPNGQLYSDGTNSNSLCKPNGCTLNSVWYASGTEKTINKKEVDCSYGIWCPRGFEFDTDMGVCKMKEETCIKPTICNEYTFTNKWFYDEVCIKPQTSQSCCFVEYGTTKYYGYDLLDDKQEINIYY